jgi:CheY-like chemotaxis protein
VEVAIVVILTIVVIAVKGFTSLWLGQLTTQIREEESEEVDVLQRLEAVEATKLQLERERQAVEREQKLLENERDLVALDIQKLGVEPLPESALDEVAAAETKAGKAGATGDEAAAEPEAPADQPGKVKVLVVDDNQDLRELLQQILSKSYRVTAAADGYEALTNIVQGKERYDVVVTDLKMPNVNGIALMQSLPRDVPVIVISGFLQREEFQQALKDLSPFAVFEKPFKTAELKDAIQRAAPEAQADGQTVAPAEASAAGTSGAEPGRPEEAPAEDTAP